MSRFIGRVYSILLALLVVAGVSLAQTYTDWTLNGNVVNNGTIRVNRDIINNTTGLVTVSGTGIVRLQGNVGAITAHAIRSTTGTYPISFAELEMIQNRPTTCQVDITVADLKVGNTTTTYTAGGVGFSIGARTLTLSNLSYYNTSSTAALTFSGGTVNYSGSGSQSVLVGNSTTTYGTLGLTGTANMTIPNVLAGSVSVATLNHSGSGTLTVNDSTTITTSGTIGTLATVASGKLLNFAGTSSSTIGTVTTIAGTLRNSTAQSLGITTVSGNAGIIENTSSGTFTIAMLSANTSTIQNTNIGTLLFTGAAANTGNITNTSTGAISFNNNVTNNTPGVISNTSTGTITFVNNLSGTGTISQTAGGILNVGGLFTQNTYTLTGTNGTVVYKSTTAQTVIGGISYYNLTISNATDTTLANYKTANGILTVAGNLTINTGNTLDMQGFSTSSFGVGSNNLGKIKWSGANFYVAGTGMTEFYGSNSGNVAVGNSYGNMLFSGTGNLTFNGSTTATGNVTVNPAASVTVGSVTVQINGDLNNSGTLINNGTINIGN